MERLEMRMNDLPYDEIQRLRGLVPERPDWHLANWGDWRRRYNGVQGYGGHSAGLASGGVSGEDAFEHLCEPVDEWAAEVCDAIIDELSVQHKIALQHVYEAAVWSFRRLSLEDVLVDAAAAFWCRAMARDLV